ncbi:phosphatidylinositol phosphatase PTPRQ-like [Ylistrum balloti]|uniref:phosphatidylinositol phosphatase PTPRQ-like n=1 Tax=Ylistrum balloti TaxID=509963 RepID=UPI002905E351|nr:phosphatidylinositol phosphatase PTPRQ-like [Ylistrum balloti]
MSGHSTTSNSINVTLTSEGLVDRYIATSQCSSLDNTNSLNVNVTVTNHIVKIDGLDPDTTCDVTVIAVFHKLNSSAALFRGLRTNETAPGPVGDLVALTLSSTAVRLTWNKPINPNGDITQYSVHVTYPNGTCVQLIQLLLTAGRIAMTVRNITLLTTTLQKQH